MSLYTISIILSVATVIGTQPNIIFILTDDQDVRLNSMQAMPNAQASIKAKGISFENAFAATPVCCLVYVSSMCTKKETYFDKNTL